MPRANRNKRKVQLLSQQSNLPNQPNQPNQISQTNQSMLSHLFPECPDLAVYCINLKERNHKRKWFKKQMRKHRIDFDFYTAELHPTSPKRGCLESHLAVIKQAIADNKKHILIFEDDAKIIRPLKPIPTPPKDWKMLYLGGTVRDILGTPEDKNWTPMSCWTTHAYMLNLEDKSFIKDLLEMEQANMETEIDTFYMQQIHSAHKTYMVSPMRVIQREGYSDIEKKEVNYDFMEDTLYGFKKPEHTISDNSYCLKLPEIEPQDLPPITVITPTYNRRDLFYIALKNMSDTSYPKEKIHWIIVDDTDDPLQDVSDLLPKSKNINHIKLTDKHYTIAEKRNIGAAHSKTSLILHMDDDDYYPTDSFLARTKLLLKYTDMGCVGSSKLGVWDIITNKSTLATDGPLTLLEASMAYRKEFWLRQKFNPKTEKGEQFDFLAGRFDEVLDMPFTFNVFAITHNKNITQKMRRIDQSSDKQVNFIDDWDVDTQLFFYQLRDRLRKTL